LFREFLVIAIHRPVRSANRPRRGGRWELYVRGEKGGRSLKQCSRSIGRVGSCPRSIGLSILQEVPIASATRDCVVIDAVACGDPRRTSNRRNENGLLHRKLSQQIGDSGTGWLERGSSSLRVVSCAPLASFCLLRTAIGDQIARLIVILHAVSMESSSIVTLLDALRA